MSGILKASAIVGIAARPGEGGKKLRETAQFSGQELRQKGQRAAKREVINS